MGVDLRRKVYDDFYEWRNVVNNFNRFDIRSPLLSLLEDNVDLYTCWIREGQSVFRGRIFNFDNVAKSEEEYLAFINSNEKVFEGYSAKISGAPPKENATEGRLNCKGISFLYTSNEPKTVVYELRPIKHELLSIAEFVTRKDVRFADLRKRACRRVHENEALYILLRRISNEFSRPHYAGHNYWFTQYLAGQFINMGFDGVVFESSLLPDGDNLVFFYPEDCEAINSHLYRVDKISISFDGISRENLQ
ncbi:MAG: RES family NAD+ phosphorylase [Clostridia bacterium]|nr:RES family NAD+ phosphorylase [Clostridia bacterium]